jgi:hypothetical protein
MATVAIFFGIVITMFYNEHGPPHFHAEYQGQRGIFDFDGNLMKGTLRSRTARGMLRKWAKLHRDELEKNWNEARAGKPLRRIAPLT